MRRKSARQLDGNGLTARSVGNLELIRAGFPPIIIKPSERTRYLDALAQSDQAGDIHLFLELILDNALQLLADSLAYHISAALQSVCGECRMTRYPEPLSQDNCAELCAGRSVPKSWAFRLWISVPGRAPLEKLAWFGCRSPAMVQHLDLTHGPALYWSSGNSLAFPPWFVDSDHSPFAVELTTATGHGDSGLQDTLTSPSGPSRLLILSAGSLNRCPGCGAGLTLSQAELTFLGVKCDCWQTGRRVVPTAQTPARRKFGCGLSRSR